MLRALWFNENACDEHWPLSTLLGQPADGAGPSTGGSVPCPNALWHMDAHMKLIRCV